MTSGTQQQPRSAAGPGRDSAAGAPTSIGRFRKGLARWPGTDALITLARLPGASATRWADGPGQAPLLDFNPGCPASPAAVAAASHLMRGHRRATRDGTQFACVPGGPIPQIHDAIQTALHDHGPVQDRKFTDRHEHRAQIVALLLTNQPALARVLTNPGFTCGG
jgi:hypothetical protein